MVAVHEGAGAVIDGFARDAAIVGVHHAVDEAEAEPVRHQRRLTLHDGVQEGRGIGCVGIMPGDRIVEERLQRLGVAPCGKDLERTDAQVALRHPGQHGAGQGLFPYDPLAGPYGGQRAGGRHAKGVHRFAHHVFTQHRPQPGAPVAHAGIGRATRSLELNVAADAIGAHGLAQEHRAPVAKLRVVLAELVAGIKLCQRRCAFGQGIAGEHVREVGIIQPVDAQVVRKRSVDRNQGRCFHGLGGYPGEKAVGQGGVAVVEGNLQGHVPDIGTVVLHHQWLAFVRSALASKGGGKKEVSGMAASNTYGMTLKDRPEFASKPKPLCFSPTATVAEAVAEMSEKNFGSVVIVDKDEKVIGIATERDVMKKLVNAGKDAKSTTLADIMTKDPRMARATDDVVDWLRIMSNDRFRRLPVVDDEGRIMVIFTQGDFVSYTWPDLIFQAKELAKASVGRNYPVWLIGGGIMLYSILMIIVVSSIG